MSEEEAQHMMQQLQALEAYSAELEQREGTLAGMFREAAAASESIRNFKDGASEALMPVGTGAFVPAKVSPDAKVLLHIGAGVSVEKDFESAANYLEARIKEIDVAMRDTNGKRQEAASRIEEARARLGQMMQKPGQDNV